MKKQLLGWLKFGCVLLLMICSAQCSFQNKYLLPETQIYVLLKYLCVLIAGVLLSAGKRNTPVHPSIFAGLVGIVLMAVSFLWFAIPGIHQLVRLFLLTDGYISIFVLLTGLLLGWLIPGKSAQ